MNKMNRSQFVKRFQKPLILLGVMLVMVILQPRIFPTFNNMLSILYAVSIYGTMICGMIYAVLLGGIDLSVGPVAALSGAVTVLTIIGMGKTGTSVVVGIVLGLLAGAAVGLVNGLIISYFDVPAFLITLSTQSIINGVAQLTTGNHTIAAMEPPSFTFIGSGRLLGVPVPIYIMGIMMLLTYIILNKTVFGQRVYAVGGNRQAAALLTEEGCAFVTASPELTGAELKRLNSEFCDRRYQRLSADGCSMETVTQIKDLDRCATIQNSELKLPIISVVYGRQRLMLLHHCPARTALGLTKGHRDCRMCDEGSPDALKGQALEDRKGYRFPLLRQRLPEGCMTELMNALPTDNINNSELKERGSGTAIVLTTENPDETEQVLNAFKEGRKVPGETTSGHWKRPVE